MTRAVFSTMKMRGAVLICLVVCFLISRVFYLDADLPAWQVAFYQPIDEFYYTIPAFNLFHFSHFSYSPLPGEAADGANALANMLENGITLFTLKLFGNNYFGLRMASVFAATAALILTFQALLAGTRKLSTDRNGESAFYPGIAVFAIFLFDFSFNLGSRVAEPTIFSILYTSVLAYAFSRIDSVTGRNAAFVGALAGGAPLFGYLYLAFLVPAAGLAIVIFTARDGVKIVARNCGWFVVGATGAVTAYLATVFFVSNGEVERYISFLNQAGGQRLAGTPFNLAALKSYAYDFLAGNIFRFNPALLATTLASFFALIFFKPRKLPLLYCFVLTALFFRFLQFIVLSDHYHRKLLDLVPFVFLLIGTGLHLFSSTEFRKKTTAWTWTAPTLSLLLAAASLALIVTGHRVYGYLSGNSLNIYGGESIWLERSHLNLVLVSIGLVGFAFLIGWRAAPWARKVAFPAMVLVACAIPGLLFSQQFIYSEPQFKYRDTQRNLSPLIDKKILVGGYSYGFRLYNTSIPYFNKYTFLGTPEEYRKRLAELLNNEKAWGVIESGSLKLKAEDLVIDYPLTTAAPLDIGDVEDKTIRYLLIHK